MEEINSNAVNPYLVEQQNDIITSKESKIVVQAGPGSGKTYTLVQKIKKDNLNLDSAFIALSFTKESSANLMSKIGDGVNSELISKSFIGTLDSFMMTFIARFVAIGRDERFYNLDWKKVRVESDNVKDPKQWIDLLSNCSIYHMSDTEYKVGIELLHNQYIHSYYKGKYSTIYIDEAQDLSKNQFAFINEFAHIFNLNIIYIGDVNQTLYKFKGASPDSFMKLSTKGFKRYTIEETVRCPQDIKILAEKYLIHPRGEKFEEIQWVKDIRKGENISLRETNKDVVVDRNGDNHLVQLPVDYDGEFLNNNDCLLLGPTHRVCQGMQNVINSNGIDNVFYVYPISDINFNSKTEKGNNLHNLLKYFLNVNERGIYHHLIKEMDNKYIEKINKCNDLMEMFNIANESKFININHSNVCKIINKLQENCHYYYYKKDNSVNRIMTIHQSKGLEADYVFVTLNSLFHRDTPEVRREYYVAFTRAKKHLFIEGRKDDIDKIEFLINNTVPKKKRKKEY